MATNPFERTGTSDYPVTTPYVGQETAFKRLKRFLKNDPDSSTQVMLAFGDWGTGKTRLGHQVIAACTGSSPGWQIEEGSGFVEKSLLPEGGDTNNILPLWIHLNECESRITTENAARVLVNQGLENLINGDNSTQTAIQDKLKSEGVFLELSNKFENASTSPDEKLETVCDIIENKTDIDRVVAIVDEVEEASAIEQTAPDSADVEGVESRTISALYEGLKEAHNDEGNKYPANFKTDFFLLCTDEVENSIPSGGVERRVEPINLRHPTVREARQYVKTAVDSADLEVSIDDGCVEGLFFASFNNYGWFTLAMSNIVYYKQENADPPYFEVLRNNYDVFTRIFNSKIIDDILAEGEEVGSSVVDALFRLRPVSQLDLGVSDEQLNEILSYTTPFEDYQPMASMSVLDIDASKIKRKLNDVGYKSESEDPEEQVTRIAGESLDANRLEDILEVFSNQDGNVVLYDQQSNLAELAEFSFGRGGVKEDAVNELTEVLADLRDTHSIEDEQFIGSSLSFLRVWNKRWSKVSSIVQWIDENDVWEGMNSAARDVSEDRDERILEGLIHTRFNHFDTGPVDLETRTDLKSTNRTVDIPDDDPLAVVSSGRAVVLKSNTDSNIRDDLRDIQRQDQAYPLVYVLTESEAEKEELLPELRADYPKLAPFINSFVISPEKREDKFYIQMSFLGDPIDQGGFSDTHIYQNNINYLQQNHRRPLILSDEEWKQARYDEGEIVDQLVPDRVDVEDLAEGIRAWITHQSGDWRSDDDATEAWDDVNSAEEVHPLIRMPDINDQSKDKFDLPKFVPKLLDIINEYGPFQVATLSGRILHDANMDTKIKTSMERTLKLFEALDILDETPDGYRFVDEDYLLDDIVDSAKVKIPDNIGEYFEDFYYPPSSKTRVDFRIDDDTISSRREGLDEARDTVDKIKFKIVTAIDSDQDSWLDKVSDIRKVVTESRRWYQSEDTELDLDSTTNDELEELYLNVRDDTEHSEYSIYYRIELLEQFDTILKENCTTLISRVEDRLEDVEKKYNYFEYEGEEVEFPTDTVKSILEDIKTDLQVNLDSINDPLSSINDDDATDSTIKKHIENQEFAKTFERAEWYNDQLQDENGFWGTFEDAYGDYTDLVHDFDSVEDNWDETKSYLSGSTAYSNALTDTEIPLSTESLDQISIGDIVDDDHDRDDIDEIWTDIVDDSSTDITPTAEVSALQAIVSDPASNLSGEAPTSLHSKIEKLTRKCETIDLHRKIVKEIANNELDGFINDLDTEWAPLAHIADKLEEDVKIDKNAYEKENDFKNKVIKIEETQNKISEEGKRILKEHHKRGEHLWSDFLTTYKASSGPDRYLSNEVSQESLKNLQELGLINYEKRFEISLE